WDQLVLGGQRQPSKLVQAGQRQRHIGQLLAVERVSLAEPRQQPIQPPQLVLGQLFAGQSPYPFSFVKGGHLGQPAREVVHARNRFARSDRSNPQRKMPRRAREAAARIRRGFGHVALAFFWDSASLRAQNR